jgi:hypothetical protein
VSHATPVTFSGFVVDFPSQGEMRITGKNSSARIIALDNVNVRIEIFSNGSDTPDTIIDTTWLALTS